MILRPLSLARERLLYLMLIAMRERRRRVIPPDSLTWRLTLCPLVPLRAPLYRRALLLFLDPGHPLVHTVCVRASLSVMLPSPSLVHGTGATHKSKKANWLGLLPCSYTNRLAR